MSLDMSILTFYGKKKAGTPALTEL